MTQEDCDAVRDELHKACMKSIEGFYRNSKDTDDGMRLCVRCHRSYLGWDMVKVYRRYTRTNRNLTQHKYDHYCVSCYRERTPRRV